MRIFPPALVLEGEVPDPVPHDAVAGEVHDMGFQTRDQITELVEGAGFGDVEMHLAAEPVGDAQDGLFFLFVVERWLVQRCRGREEDS